MTANILFLILSILLFISGYHLSKSPDYSLFIDHHPVYAAIYRLLPKFLFILAALCFAFILVDVFLPDLAYAFRNYMLFLLVFLLIIGLGFLFFRYMFKKKK